MENRSRKKLLKPITDRGVLAIKKNKKSIEKSAKNGLKTLFR
jgi:hypothetical protein